MSTMLGELCKVKSGLMDPCISGPCLKGCRFLANKDRC